MNSAAFLTVLFMPFLFSLYLIFKRLSMTLVSKKVLRYGLIVSVFASLIASITGQFIDTGLNNKFLIAANLIFIILSVVSCIYFETKKQFMFTRLRYNIFLSLLITFTYVFILSNSFLLSVAMWILSGILIYVFSYIDIFKLNSDYNSNRFYSIFLLGDFALFLAVLILVKFAILSDNYSYLLNYCDIKSILSYILGNGDYEYVIVPICLIVGLFSRSFIFPFSCFFSFLTNASNLFYLVVYSVFSPLYALILFLKLDLFDSIGSYFKIYLIISIVLLLLSLLFEKHFKIIFGYLLSILNSGFILVYFFDKTFALSYISCAYFFFLILISMLFLKDGLSLKNRPVNKNIGFIQERIMIFLFEKLPLYISCVIDFIDKKIIGSFFTFLYFIVDVLGYHYIIFIQSRKITSILKGISLVFALFALFAIFLALFGNFGEMQI